MTREVYTQIIGEARAEVPLECCGYLAGEEDVIFQVYPMENMDKSEVHYSFDPKEQLEKIKLVRKEGLTMLGVYHSHPASPARPSAEDVRLAYDSELSYVIVSLCDGSVDVRSFRIRQGHVDEEELTIL